MAEWEDRGRCIYRRLYRWPEMLRFGGCGLRSLLYQGSDLLLLLHFTSRSCLQGSIKSYPIYYTAFVLEYPVNTTFTKQSDTFRCPRRLFLDIMSSETVLGERYQIPGLQHSIYSWIGQPMSKKGLHEIQFLALEFGTFRYGFPLYPISYRRSPQAVMSRETQWLWISSLLIKEFVKRPSRRFGSSTLEIF